MNALSLLFRVKKAGGGGGPKSNHEIREGEEEEEETIIFREKEVLLIRLLLLFPPWGESLMEHQHAMQKKKQGQSFMLHSTMMACSNSFPFPHKFRKKSST